jgi:tetratricopeptide (TPR) repeat protein
MNTIGIDFGTTKTLVAAWRESFGRAEIVRLGRSGEEIPTTIHVDARRQFLFGDDADDQMGGDPSAYVRRVKRGLGKECAPRQLNGHSFSTVELVQAFLFEIKSRVESELFDGPVEHAVITVPAKYSPAAWRDLEMAASGAGFSSVELIEEPVAAGIAFLEDKHGDTVDNNTVDEILVFDWGGGTLDIALVEFHNGELIVNQDLIDGDPDLGGEDIDDDLIDAINASLIERGLPEITTDNITDYSLLYKRIVETKCLLSKKESHSFHFKTPGSVYDFPVKMTRLEFEGFISEKLQRAITCLKSCEDRMVKAGKNPSHVLLVGGTSQIPAVSQAIADLGRKTRPWNRGREAVALGAAIYAHKMGLGKAKETQDESTDDAFGHCVLAETKARNRDYEGAIVEFSKAIALNPKIAEAFYGRGLCKLNLYFCEYAIIDFDMALKLDENDAWSYVFRGHAKAVLTDYNGAIDDYTKALEIHPNLADAADNLAIIRGKQAEFSGESPPPCSSVPEAGLPEEDKEPTPIPQDFKHEGQITDVRTIGMSRRVFAILFLLYVGVSTYSTVYTDDSTIFWILGYLLMLLPVSSRLKNIGKSSWLNLFILIPPAYFVVICVCLFRPDGCQKSRKAEQKVINVAGKLFFAGVTFLAIVLIICTLIWFICSLL